MSWAKIVNLGEQKAGIYVDKLQVRILYPPMTTRGTTDTVQVGLLFLPSWTRAVVVVSEAETRTRLPLFAMTTYTKAVIERLQPTR